MTAAARGVDPAPFTLGGVDVVLSADASEREWLAARQQGVGGSDVAAAAGISEHKTPYRLWLEKTDRVHAGVTAEQEDRFRWGHLLEPVVRGEFARLHPEFVVTPSPGTLAAPAARWQRVNVDGLIWTPAGALEGVWEGKTSNHRQARAWADDEVPVAYTSQVQWAMHITGADRAFVCALIDTNTYVEREVPRDQELIDGLVHLATGFWDLVLADEPPDIDGTAATRAALALLESAPGSRVVLPAAWAPVVARRHELHAQIKELEGEKRTLDNQVRAAMGIHESAYVGGQQVATHKAPKDRRSCDFDGLKEAFPEAYAQFVTTKPSSRRLNYTAQRDDTTTESNVVPIKGRKSA